MFFHDQIIWFFVVVFWHDFFQWNHWKRFVGSYHNTGKRARGNSENHYTTDDSGGTIAGKRPQSTTSESFFSQFLLFQLELTPPTAHSRTNYWYVGLVPTPQGTAFQTVPTRTCSDLFRAIYSRRCYRTWFLRRCHCLTRFGQAEDLQGTFLWFRLRPDTT